MQLLRIEAPRRRGPAGDVGAWLARMSDEQAVVIGACLMSMAAIAYTFAHGDIIAYGDAESHLNIAKRVVDGLTAGFAQLGGIWLPLPHILMLPFVAFDPLWRTGLAGSIVSGAAYVVTCVYLFRLTLLMTESRLGALVTCLVFSLNPNVLYMQATPMTELPLIAFFVLSIYYFYLYLLRDGVLPLVLAGVFAFAASLSRYDGWALVLAEAGVLGLLYIGAPVKRRVLEGRLILFSSVAFFGIGLWLAWGWLILGDPLYFSHSSFSAAAQQQALLARGQLPSYRNWLMSFLYYGQAVIDNAGSAILAAGGIGLMLFAAAKRGKHWFLPLLLLTPLAFYVVTLYMGESVIFVPQLTPASFQWRLFNVRYGITMMPAAAVFTGYLVSRAPNVVRPPLLLLLVAAYALYPLGYARTMDLVDGTEGLSAAKGPDAQNWMRQHYDGGLVLLDDYARTISVIKSDIPMQDLIYVGSKPYWNESLQQPEKYATWIVLQKDDAVWKALYDDPDKQAELFKYFEKVYTSPNLLIFRRQS